jgi:hypothetical protein
MKFRDVLAILNIPHVTEGHHHCRPGWIQLDCPFCGRGTKRYHLGYKISGHYMNCWRCGRQRIPEVLAEYTGKSWQECRDLIKDLERETHSSIPITRRFAPPPGLGPLLPAHRRYLRGRGFDPDDLVRLWGIQGIGPISTMPWRIYIPIHFDGRPVSWTTRSILDNGQRYISAAAADEAVPHKSLLYGEEYVRNSICLVEGPTDVWAIGVGSCCCFGVGFSRAQVMRIAKYPIRVTCFDNDAAGQQRAEALCDLLEGFPGRTYNVRLSGKDPASSPFEERQQLRKEFLDVD